MNQRPDDATAAAIAAAVALIMRTRQPSQAPPVPGWRLAARLDRITDAAAARAARRRSRWSA